MKHIFAGILMALALSLGEFIINGSTKSLSVQAMPNNAKIELLSIAGNKIFESRGSLVYELKSSTGFFHGGEYIVKVAAPGYETQTINICASSNAGYIVGNVFSGGVIGWLILDPIIDSMLALEAQNGQEVATLQVMLKKNALLQRLSKSSNKAA